uniref:Uncharacterized protein LOC104227264 n=1 Tax=Nicotiana sylvestris TaxID=4096 RepID=A0A1U7WGK2_NICSY|nr:PREDICTED: uncharacterized protein LOC104227264 [Nicotiana sylvestris]XP_009777783.1 PREDICTED: uncharacterized protein LOC104227264 [Nicotiana sylvestris]
MLCLPVLMMTITIDGWNGLSSLPPGISPRPQLHLSPNPGLVHQLGGHHQGLKALIGGSSRFWTSLCQRPVGRRNWPPNTGGRPRITVNKLSLYSIFVQVARLLKEALTRTGSLGFASDAGASSRSPRSENKQPKISLGF